MPPVFLPVVTFVPAAVGAVVRGAFGAIRPAAAAPPGRGFPGKTDPAEDQTTGGGQYTAQSS